MQDELSIEKARVAILVEERNELLREEQVRRLTQRALDLWESARFTSIFLALGLSCSQAVTQPRPQTSNANR